MSKPRLAFVGLGWIGGLRLDAVVAADVAQVVALCDADVSRLDRAGRAHPGVVGFRSYERLLDRAADLGLDGVVVCTPNACHAEQSVAALERGLAVFCQKPLARTAGEVREVISAARNADRNLAVDYSYRWTLGARILRRLAQSGTLGTVRHVETVFHNAYGPGKAWCYDPAQGGGALLDLGVHLVDLVLWILGDPPIEHVAGTASRVRAGGHCPIAGGEVLDDVDDFAYLVLRFSTGAAANVTVSWNAHIGADAAIRATLFGAEGGAELRNVRGSFYDFEVLRFSGRTAEHLGHESREWMSGCILDWVRRLSADRGYDPAVETSLRVAEIVDAVYGRTPIPSA